MEENYYYPFGELKSHTGSLDVKYKFNGHEFDAESGLYYMGARYYDPKLGRFISADTVVQFPFYPQSLNRYSFTLNNPVMIRELDGHCGTVAPPCPAPTPPSRGSSEHVIPDNGGAVQVAQANAGEVATDAHTGFIGDIGEGGESKKGPNTAVQSGNVNNNCPPTVQSNNCNTQTPTQVGQNNPGIEYDPSASGILSNPDTQKAVRELGENLGADKINVVGADRTREVHEQLRKEEEPGSSLAICSFS